MCSRTLFLCVFVLLSYCLSAQEYTQTLRGTIVDKDSKAPLFGAVVIIPGSEPLLGCATDEQGRFKLEKVTVGRKDIKITYLGYNEMIIPNVVVNSGKEVVLYIEMTESVVNKQEIVVSASKQKGNANNEMAVVSARVFTIEETNRYAGALGDPARMAANFAGVSAPNDSRNDIIIRGNSPIGLLWRLEGIDIPSPNHFSAQGATGGPVSILNNNVLRNSDFFTGAWPAEYGNAISGVFDLKLRNGNNEKHEYTGQVGFNGFEAMAEGPISKEKGSSYLASYRYSALGFFQALGLNLGPAGVPKYQDLSFKINLPLNAKNAIEIFGIGGISNIELLDSKKKAGNLSYGQVKRDVYFGSDMGVFGISYTKMLGKSSFWKTTLSQSIEDHKTRVDSLATETNQPKDFYKDASYTYKTSVHSYFNDKLNARNTLRAGIIFSRIDFKVYSAKTFHNPAGEIYWRDFTNDKGNTYLGQGYLNWKHDFSARLSLLGGVQYEQFLFNNTRSLEPRAGLKWNFAERQSLSIGYGLHGQIQPLALYFYKTEPLRGSGDYIETNKNMGFTQSNQYVAAYDLQFSKDFRFKLETYYQQLYNVPITLSPSSYSVLNNGADFGIQLKDYLVNKGTGRNYGLEGTLEKFFSHNYYFLVTASIFDSKYKGSDGVERNTAFNGNYTINALAGKDFPIGKNNVITFSGKATLAGGRRYSPADTAQSRIWRELIYIQDKAYSLQYPAYFVIAARIGYKRNSKNITQEYAIDIQNLTNRKNILDQIWDPVNNKVDIEYQLGIFPMILYRLQF
jgi:hypothetical protein